MQNSTHTRLRMLACGCLLLPTEFLEKPLILHPWQTLSLNNFLCAYKEGFTSSISHHSLLYNSIHYLSRIQLLCDEILPNSYTQKNTHPTKLFFFHSWLFGSIFVFILSLNHGFIHFLLLLRNYFSSWNSISLQFSTQSYDSSQAHHGLNHIRRRFFFPYSVFCSFSFVPHCNSNFLKLECLDVFELTSFTTPRKFNCFEHANIFSYNPCQDLTSVLFQAHDSNTICFPKSCSN